MNIANRTSRITHFATRTVLLTAVTSFISRSTASLKPCYWPAGLISVYFPLHKYRDVSPSRRKRRIERSDSTLSVNLTCMTRRDFNIRTCEQILMISSFERTKWIRNRCPRPGEHPPSELSACVFAVVSRSRGYPLHVDCVVTGALTSDPLLATGDTDYLPSESIGACACLQRAASHAYVQHVRPNISALPDFFSGRVSSIRAKKLTKHLLRTVAPRKFAIICIYVYCIYICVNVLIV